jgi:hypothetical protein
MRCVMLLVLGTTSAAAIGQSLVYQSGNWSSLAAPVNGINLVWDANETSGNVESPNGNENVQRIGDVIRLAGSDRTLTRVRLQVGRFGNAAGTGSIDLGLHIYSASGFANNNPSWPGGGLLWEGVVSGIDLSWDSNFANRRRYVTFDLPLIAATNELFIAFSAPNVAAPVNVLTGIVANPQAGPSIGTRFQRSQWLQPTGTTTWQREPGIDQFPFWALEMQVFAVPAPGSVVVVAGLAMCAARRRRA